ncbi:MAG: sulfotransferase [Microcoleaceae cyanobacterium MO_207.B10]|nr:sulfotransferase [Microcoleaceae cyanobacterium MO_207.B10]
MSLNFQSILIVTYGRSGSTLLQGILNNIDGVLVRGENNNFIYGLYEAYKKLIDVSSHKDTSQPNHSWYGGGEIDLELFLNDCREMVRNVLLANSNDDKNVLCYGFKEIRYFEVYQQTKDITDYLNFLGKIFPKPAFIFNTRNLDDVLKSGWWAKMNTESRTRLIELEIAFQAYIETHQTNSFMVSYEDVVCQLNNFKLLFDFLGAAYPENMDEILLTPHGYGQKNIQANQNFTLKLTPASLYHHLFVVCEIDNVPKRILPSQEFNLAGVVIPANNQMFVSGIYIMSSGKIVRAELGLNSPVYGKKYTQILASNNARFKFHNLIFPKSENLHLFVEINDCQKVEIATLYIDFSQ